MLSPRMFALIGAVLAATAAPDTSFVSPRRGTGAGRSVTQNYDIRVLGRAERAALEQRYAGRSLDDMRGAGRVSLQRLREALDRLRSTSPDARTRLSPLTGGIEVLAAAGRGLTAPAPARPADELAREFLRDHRDLYGLSDGQLLQLEGFGESLSRRTGLRMVRLRQVVNGLPVFQSDTRVLLDGEGRVVRTVGRLVPGIDETAVPVGGPISAAEALRSAMETIGIDLAPGRMKETAAPSGDQGREIDADDGRITRTVHSEPVYFPLSAGVLVPAWSQVTFTRDAEDWYTLVDARTGVLLFRKNVKAHASTQQARFSVYTQEGGIPADSPAPASPNSTTPGSGTQFPAIARNIESMLARQDPIASPDGWIPDGGSTTTGNNVDAYLDRNGDNVPDMRVLDNRGRPVGNPDASGRNRDFLGATPRNFNYTPPPLGNNPDAGDDLTLSQYQRGVVTHLFFVANFYHDCLYGLGFDEAAGNFQTNNFMRGGAKGDPVHAEAQQGADLGFADDASFSTPPDGGSGILQLLIAPGPAPDRDYSLESETIVHELTHGLSNRLIGNAAGLIWAPALGLGEGWSDFFAHALLNTRPSDDPNGQYPDGPYTSYRLTGTGFTDNYFYGFRRFPYTTSHTLNPLTWADIDEITIDTSGGVAPSPLPFFPLTNAIEPHKVGELWANTLWAVRSLIIAANGGDVASGNRIMLGIVVDGMKMTPIDPSYTDARDALFDADCATNGCANEDAIWAGFAERGLGYKAEASFGIGYDAGVKESYAVPSLEPGTVVIDDSAGNHNGFIDPGETVSITVPLVNPWRSAGKSVAGATATLGTADSRITIGDGSATYGPIPAQGTASGDPFTFTLRPGVICGQSLDFTLQTTSALGTFTQPLSLRVGRPAGPGAPVTLTRTIPGGLAIPDGSQHGVADTFTVPDDLQITDLDFRIDDLTHPLVGDLALELKAPFGFGTDLIIGLLDCKGANCITPNQGANFLNTRFDDSSTSDLYIAGSRAAPFTGSWFPNLNSPKLGAPSDPFGQMSHYRAPTSRGPWQVAVYDPVPGNSGRLNSWSLIVTPMSFTCGP